MQEIAIILGSLAGVATAAAAIRIAPKGNSTPDDPQNTGESRYLEIERDILTKTIARLYETDTGLTRNQRDGLLIKYQRQLETIQLKIQRLRHTGSSNSSRETDQDVGNLMIRMDEKLSKLDERIHELSLNMAETKERLLQETRVRRQVQEEKQQQQPPSGEPARIHADTPADIPATSLPEAPVVIPASTDAKTDDPARAGGISRETPRPRSQKIRPLPKPRKIDVGVEPKKQQTTTDTTTTTTLTEPNGKSQTTAKTAKPDAPPASQTDIRELEDPSDDINDAGELKKIKDDINRALTKLDQTEVE